MKEQKNSNGGLQVKSESQGIIAGRASVYGVVDSAGEIVMPGSFSKSLAKSRTVPVLAQHEPSDVIGIATLTDKPDGLHFEAKLELGLQSARDMLTRVKSGLISGVSIGYVTEKSSFDKSGNRLLNEISLWEISLVTFPANSEARVESVKKSRDGEIAAVLDAVERNIKAWKNEIAVKDTVSVLFALADAEMKIRRINESLND